MYLQKDIEFVKTVGPQRAQVFRTELGIFTVEDLLHHFPFRYVDRSRFYNISELNADLPYVQLKGVITSISGFGNKRTTRLQASFRDETGTMDLVWFQGIKWIRESVKAGTPYIIFGKPTLFNGVWNMVHPELETQEKFDENPFKGFQPVYATTEKSKTKGLDSKGIMRAMHAALKAFPAQLAETLPDEILQQHQLHPVVDSYLQIHFPSDSELLRKARQRFKFEELFYIQLKLLQNKQLRTEAHKGRVFGEVGYLFNTFYKDYLPFELTNAQKRVLKEIRKDTVSGNQMNRLVQGDVGSGKTVVALLAMLLALDNKQQACMMTPLKFWQISIILQ